jgi:hypothetical protein
MSKAAAQAIVGPPEFVQTGKRYRAWLAGVSEIWSYGADSYGSPEIRGSICFDEAGDVRFVYGPNGAADAYVE